MSINIQQLIVEPRDFADELHQENQVLVDLCKADIYQKAHIPGAIHLEYSNIIRNENPVFGMLPTERDLAQTLGKLGITPDSRIVAYDDEGGGKAARFLWTLMLTGHQNLGLINGGMHAWVTEQLPTDKLLPDIAPTLYPVTFKNLQYSADQRYILDNLENDDVILLDARTPGEFAGTDVRAARGGHIPGAINFDWMNGMNKEASYRMHAAEDLLPALESIGITPEKEVIAYCHSHHRSAFSFIMLRAIGFERVRGYPGSWSEWGNQKDTPIEQ